MQKLSQKKIIAKIIIKKNVHDIRSYNLDSSKLLKIGFKPKKSINDAINELKQLYENKELRNRPNYYSIKWLKAKITKLWKEV